MTDIRMRIPARQTNWLRKNLLEELNADLETDQIEVPADVLSHTENINRYAGILDQLGWSRESEEDDLEISVDTEFMEQFIRREVRDLAEPMKVATGDYIDTAFDRDGIESVCERGLWLLRLESALGDEQAAETVTA